MSIPEPQIVIGSCKLARVSDGDTVEVEIVRRVRVRLADCWAPEKRKTGHPCEKSLGIEAAEMLALIAAEGTPCRLAISTDGDQDVGDGLTFGRVVGRVYLTDPPSGSIGERMIAGGWAFATKSELEKHLTDTDNAAALANYENL